MSMAPSIDLNDNRAWPQRGPKEETEISTDI